MSDREQAERALGLGAVGSAGDITSRRLVMAEAQVKSMPILFLWPHARCNCRCVMCDIWKNKSREELSLEQVTAWAEEWKALGVQSVVLTGGEALMHSRIAALFEVLRASGFRVSILSTGITLHAHAAEVVRHCDAVYVSLDGPREVHNDIRGIPTAFEKLAHGIAAVKALKPSFPVRARCTVQRRNFDRLRETVDAALELKVDWLAFSAADVSSEAYNRPGGWGPEEVGRVALTAEQLPGLEEEINLLARDHKARFESGYIIDSPERLRRRVLRYYQAVLGQVRFPLNTCNAPWISAVVEYDGTVRPCFLQPAYGKAGQAGGFNKVVNSEQALEFRRRLSVETNPICARCVCATAIYQCDCSWTRTPPYCDNTCSLVAEFLA